ncbi:MAG: transposase [Candidatus Eisenbacteria bacterium]|nr:transposase [Candidatus Eisenbacteria bacterium]
MRVKSQRVVDVEKKAVEALLERCKALLSPEDFELLRGLVDTLARMEALVRERGSSMARLRRLFGLSGSEKSRDVLPPQPPAAEPAPAADPAHAEPASDEGDDAAAAAVAPAAPAVPPAVPPAAPVVPPSEPTPEPPKKKRKGHGRIPASDYVAARHVAVSHATLRAGDSCPKCPGKIYRLKEPAPIVRIVGQPPLTALCWDCECLRCAACGVVYTARAPEEAQGEKYDETAASMMALLHYGAGMPFHRLERVQSDLDTPVPSSTQWDIARERAELVRPAFGEMVRLTAQGEVLHNDDSYVRILALMGKRRAALLAAGKLPDPDRTGLFTTAIVARVAKHGDIALFFTGRQHAGENLADLLTQRAASLAPPILMGDALTRNLPKGHEVRASNCIVHGRRQIVDELDNYPTECRYVIERIALVYKVDDDCKGRGVSDEERLLAHQEESAAPMEEARAYMAAQLEEKRVEPNSNLGKAFNYFLKRWDKFTLFLRAAGAPLDNNICERALKKAIMHRNASLFYRSERGAEVGDIYMTLIYTAELHGQNPFDYLTELQRNYNAVAARPGDWLPWTYKETLARLAPREPARAGPLAA